MVETFEPPTIPITGRSGWPSAASSASSSRRMLLAGVGGQKVGDGLGRGVGAVRGREGVVDVEVAEHGELPGEVRSLASSPAWKRRFSSSSTPPGFRTPTAASATSPMQSSANATGTPSSFDSGSTTGLRLIDGTRLPFGRSKWLIRIVFAPPLRSRSIVGRAHAQAGVVGDLAVVQRHVEVHPHQRPLARKVDLIERAEGQGRNSAGHSLTLIPATAGTQAFLQATDRPPRGRI